MKHTSLKTIIGLAGLVFATSATANPIKLDGNMLTGPYARIGFAETWHTSFTAKGANSYVAGSRPKVSTSFHLGAGGAFTPAVRADLLVSYGELKYRASKAGTSYAQKLSTLSVLANGYYDICMHHMVVPYLMAGAGVSRINSGDLIDSTPAAVSQGTFKTNFAWNAGVGLKFVFDKNYALDLGYRYLDLGKAKVNNVAGKATGAATQRVRGHQGLLSLIYKF